VVVLGSIRLLVDWLSVKTFVVGSEAEFDCINSVDSVPTASEERSPTSVTTEDIAFDEIVARYVDRYVTQ
jgi:hypothetical protein